MLTRCRWPPERSLTEALLRVTSRSESPPVSLEISGEPMVLPAATSTSC
jgi:hypothetical protein